MHFSRGRVGEERCRGIEKTVGAPKDWKANLRIRTVKTETRIENTIRAGAQS